MGKRIVIAILIFFIVATVLMSLIKEALDSYTRHGQQVEIPDVRGRQVKEIENIFKQKKLRYVIRDSFFVSGNIPGSILETVPPIGTNVKPGRIISLIINSYNDLLLVIPTIENMSRRQAQSLLQSIGFKYVQTKTVVGKYKDLVVGLEDERGNKLNPGNRITANAHLFILVSSGTRETPSLNNAATIDSDSEEEPWN